MSGELCSTSESGEQYQFLQFRTMFIRESDERYQSRSSYGCEVL